MKKFVWYILVLSLVIASLAFLPSYYEASAKPYPGPQDKVISLSPYPGPNKPIPTSVSEYKAPFNPIMNPMEEDTSYIDWAILEGMDNVWFFCGSCSRVYPELYIGEASIWYRLPGHHQYTVITVYMTYYGTEAGTGKPVYLGHTNLNICTEFELHLADMRLASPFEDWDADNLPVWNTWCGNFLPVIDK